MKKLLNSTAAANASTVATTATVSKKAGAPKIEDRVAPVFAEIRTDIAPPAGAKRGAKSVLAEKLAVLPVNGSYGITNKTKKQVTTAISKINNSADNMQAKKDATGNVVTKQGEAIKDANGVVVGHGPSVPVMEKIKLFEAHDVDAKTDPDKATVRIFRVQ